MLYYVGTWLVLGWYYVATRVIKTDTRLVKGHNIPNHLTELLSQSLHHYLTTSLITNH